MLRSYQLLNIILKNKSTRPSLFFYTFIEDATVKRISFFYFTLFACMRESSLT